MSAGASDAGAVRSGNARAYVDATGLAVSALRAMFGWWLAAAQAALGIVYFLVPAKLGRPSRPRGRLRLPTEVRPRRDGVDGTVGRARSRA